MLMTIENDGVHDYLEPIKDDFGYAELNNKVGRIRLENSGNPVTNSDHSQLEYDKIIWWQVGNPTIYPGTKDAPYENKLLDDRTIDINYLNGTNIDIRKYVSFDTTNTTRILKIGIPDNANIPINGSKSTYELNFNGKKYRLKMKVEPFDPTYYGRVYPSIESFTKNDEYQDINTVGNSKRIEKENTFSPVIENGDIYIDLGTKYRDYLRYEGIFNKVGSMKVVVGDNFSQGQEVDIISKENPLATSIKGKLVFKGNGNKFESEKQVKLFSTNTSINEEPVEYLLQVKVSEEEYKKLQPNTKYELFVKGNKNILQIGTEQKIKELKLNEPLNFTTAELGLEIKVDPSELDFGKIGLSMSGNELSRLATTNIIIKTTKNDIDMNRIDLELESDPTPEDSDKRGEIQLYYSGEDGTAEKDKSIWLNADVTLSSIDDGTGITHKEKKYRLDGNLKVKDDESTKLGTYLGEVIVNVTLNPPTE